jgi:hypothetical protein
LAQRFGRARVFRDEFTLKPGEEFPPEIERAIQHASVMLVVIGRRWLTLTDPQGLRRIDEPNDYVRREIEMGLRFGVTIVPILLDGAIMPDAKYLPDSITALSEREAFPLPWHEPMATLGRRVADIVRARAEKEAESRAEQARLDLRHLWANAPTASDVVTRALEAGLTGAQERVRLDPDDLAASMKQLTGRSMADGFYFADLVHVIDILGVKALGSTRRYVARSYPLAAFDEIPHYLRLGRPIIAEVAVFDSWFTEPTTSTGIIDASNPGKREGTTIGVVIGWNPARQELKLETAWPTWGDNGVATLGPEASEQSVSANNLRAIEPTLRPEPTGFVWNDTKKRRASTRSRRSHA